MIKPLTFVHVPKNGGTSIKHYLKQYGYEVPSRHETFKSIESPAEFSFGVVRNPWDRHVSIFFHLKKIRQISPRTKFKDYLKEKHGVFSIPQIEFLEGVKYILKFEKLKEDFKLVQDYLAVTQSLEKKPPFSNSTNHLDYHEYYTEETRKLVKSISAQDIQAFGFSFDSNS